MVLGKKEKVLMDVVYSIASVSSNGQCLVSPIDLLSKIPYYVDFRESDLEETMNQLTLDSYFSYDKARTTTGDPMYIITLRDNGISYQRDKIVAKRKLAFRLIITALVAAFSFSIKYILELIFK